MRDNFKTFCRELELYIDYKELLQEKVDIYNDKFYKLTGVSSIPFERKGTTNQEHKDLIRLGMFEELKPLEEEIAFLKNFLSYVKGKTKGFKPEDVKILNELYIIRKNKNDVAYENGFDNQVQLMRKLKKAYKEKDL